MQEVLYNTIDFEMATLKDLQQLKIKIPSVVVSDIWPSSFDIIECKDIDVLLFFQSLDKLFSDKLNQENEVLKEQCIFSCKNYPNDDPIELYNNSVIKYKSFFNDNGLLLIQYLNNFHLKKCPAKFYDQDNVEIDSDEFLKRMQEKCVLTDIVVSPKDLFTHMRGPYGKFPYFEIYEIRMLNEPCEQKEKRNGQKR